MSKPVKDMLRREIVRRLQTVGDLAVVSVVGIGGVANNRLRGDLRNKGIHVMVVRNAMARQAFNELGLTGALGLLDGPCAVAYGGESAVELVRTLLERARTTPRLQVKGALLEGEPFGAERIEELSRYPTRAEALGNLSRAALSCGGRIVSAALGPGSVLAGILKAIEDKQGESQTKSE